MTERQQQIIDDSVEFVKTMLQGAEGGHDWWHTHRVWKTARNIAKFEIADNYIVQLGALFHDIADSKFHGGNEEIGPQIARNFLETQAAEIDVIKKVEQIIRHISYKNSLSGNNYHSPEFDIVQDADRLDAIGAIGIARTFNYGGHINAEMYNPNIHARQNLTEEEYKVGRSPTLNHFYEKLLLLKDKMNTKTGKKLAENRHFFMEKFLIQFYKEWDSDL